MPAMLKVKKMIKNMYEPLEYPIYTEAVEKFVGECANSREIARAAAQYLKHKCTESSYPDQLVKTGYLLAYLLTTYSTQLSGLVAELNLLSFDDMSVAEFQTTAAINTLRLINVLNSSEKSEQQIIQQYCKTIRGITGFTSGLSEWDDDSPLNLSDIRGGLVRLGIIRLKELCARLETFTDWNTVKSDISDMNLCLNQLKDYAGDAGMPESSITDL